VISAVHIPSGKQFAVKKIFNAFANRNLAKRVLREISILKQLPRHPNVVRLFEVYEPTNNISTCEHLYLIF
jgi:serine/threonine protein kinase